VEIPGDGIDQNCDGSDAATCFVDDDLDGYGSTDTVQSADGDCNDPGESDTSDDCDDTDNTIYPGAAETADDGIDQDCNGVDAITCFADDDQDGFGSTVTTTALDGTCDTADSESDVDTDCDDTDDTVYPGAAEVADDGIDQDCNGVDAITCFVDADQDSFGSAATTTALDGTCDTGESESANDQDCDDADNTIYPGAAEVPDDGIDQDCDGVDSITCFADTDGDTFGSAATVQSADDDCTDAGESAVDTDCDDTDNTIYPGAVEIPDDGIDQDCDGVDSITCFADNSRHGSPWAANAYTRARSRGCDHPHAVRILARAWIRVLWRAWTDGSIYKPELHHAATEHNQALAA
jgi:hypothetical protein